jgi:hypothetical protein
MARSWRYPSILRIKKYACKKLTLFLWYSFEGYLKIQYLLMAVSALERPVG